MNTYTPPYKITSKILKLSTQISAMAFETGTYKCGDINNWFEATIKEDGTARMAHFYYQQTKPFHVDRGYWQDQGDAALIIRQNIVIENLDGQYLFNGNVECQKIK